MNNARSSALASEILMMVGCLCVARIEALHIPFIRFPYHKYLLG